MTPMCKGFAITAILLALPFQGSNINCQDEFFTHSLVSYTSFRGGNTISKEDHFQASFYESVAEFGFLELQDFLVKAFLRWSFRLILTTGSVGGHGLKM